MDSENLITLAKLYGSHKDYTINTISTYWAGSGDVLARLSKGKNITIRRYHSILQKASNNWPNDLAWPADIPRPTPNNSEAA